MGWRQVSCSKRDISDLFQNKTMFVTWYPSVPFLEEVSSKHFSCTFFHVKFKYFYIASILIEHYLLLRKSSASKVCFFPPAKCSLRLLTDKRRRFFKTLETCLWYILVDVMAHFIDFYWEPLTNRRFGWPSSDLELKASYQATNFGLNIPRGPIVGLL